MRTTILIPLLGLALLTGCATGTPAATSGTPTLEKTAEASERPEPAAIEGDTDGNGKLSEFEKQVLAKRNYVLLDGTTVAAPKQGEAVPVAIIENIKAVAGPSAAGVAAGSWDAANEFELLLQNEDYRLGVKVIPVVQGADGQWGSGRPGISVAMPTTKDAALAAANAFAAGVPNKYLVIVFD